MISRNKLISQRLDEDLPGLPETDFPNRQNISGASHAGARATDEIAKLVQRLFAGNGSEPPRIIVFCGVEHGNGCTFVCAHAGDLLSSQGAVPVCLIDANPFAPGLYRHFGVRPGRPISNLSPEIEANWRSSPATQVPGRKLWLMSCMDGIEETPLPINAAVGRARLLNTCSRFDYVLIDAPPVNVSVQALLLGRMADGVVLVLEANYTRSDSALRAKESLEGAGVRLLGAVLNRRTYPIPESIYRRV